MLKRWFLLSFLASRPMTERPGVELREVIGSLILLLWVSHERPAAQGMLKSWLDDLPNHEPELGHAVHAIQGGLVLGYGVDNDNDAAIRRRCQEFAAQVVEAAARGLERYFSLQKENQTDEEARRAGSYANLLDPDRRSVLLLFGGIPRRSDRRE